MNSRITYISRIKAWHSLGDKNFPEYAQINDSIVSLSMKDKINMYLSILNYKEMTFIFINRLCGF